MNISREGFLKGGIAAIVGLAAGKGYAKNFAEEKAKLNKAANSGVPGRKDVRVEAVDEEELAVTKDGTYYPQSYELITINNPNKKSYSGDLETYVIFSDTQIKKGDMISFTYSPFIHSPKEVLTKAKAAGCLNKRLYEVLEDIRVENIKGVISFYDIKR